MTLGDTIGAMKSGWPEDAAVVLTRGVDGVIWSGRRSESLRGYRSRLLAALCRANWPVLLAKVYAKICAPADHYLDNTHSNGGSEIHVVIAGATTSSTSGSRHANSGG